MHEKRSRRQFFKGTLGLLGGIATARIVGLFPEAQPLLAQGEQEEIPVTRPVQVEGGELYAGFILLPEESPLPTFVEEASPFDPHGNDLEFAGMSVQLDSLDELKEQTSFPLYLPTVLPLDMVFAGASIFQFIQSGEIWGVIANFTTGDPADGQVTSWARPQYPKPAPVWPVRYPFAHDDGPILPEKITFTPSPGIMLPSMLGYSLSWIKHDVLYNLFVENNPSHEMVVTITNSLAQV